MVSLFVVESGHVSLGGRCSGTSHTQPEGRWCLLLPGTGENGTGLHVHREGIKINSTTRMYMYVHHKFYYKSVCTMCIILVHNLHPPEVV